MKELKNYDEVFIRAVLTGLVTSLYEKISISRVRDGKESRVPIPFFFLNGNSQFMRDYYDHPPRYCPELDPKVDGNIEKVPLGELELESISTVTDELGGKYVRATYYKRVEGDMGTTTRMMSARTLFLPQSMSIGCKIRASSEVERMKIYEELVKALYKIMKFKFRYQGFHALPALVSIPDSFDMGRETGYDFPAPDGDSRPEIDVPIEVRCYLPDVDFTTERHVENKMLKGLDDRYSVQ